MPWIMEVKTSDGWRAVRPSHKNEPYTYDSVEDAARMLRICYPNEVIEARLGGDITVRVREVNQDEIEAIGRESGS